MELFKKLKHLREISMLTQQECADKIGISRSSYSLYEIGKREPDFSTLTKIARLHDVSTDYLLGLRDNPVVPVLGPLMLEEIQDLRDNLGLISFDLQEYKLGDKTFYKIIYPDGFELNEQTPTSLEEIYHYEYEDLRDYLNKLRYNLQKSNKNFEKKQECLSLISNKIDEKELELIKQYRQLDAEEKAEIRGIIRGFILQRKKDNAQKSNSSQPVLLAARDGGGFEPLEDQPKEITELIKAKPKSKNKLP